MSGKYHFDPVDLSKEEITPISREPIDRVQAEYWQSLSLSELFDERVTLNNRITYMYEMNKPDIARQIERGVAIIDQIVKQKETKGAVA